MSVPIYRKIKDLILKEIEEKATNSPIDSEREMAVKYDASRMTVRNAINELVEEGFLYREKNRGTFVADQKLLKKNTATHSLQTEELTDFNILYFGPMEAGADIAERLEVKADEKVLRIVRLNTVSTQIRSAEEIAKDKESVVRFNTMNNRPLSVEEVYFVQKDIPEEDLNNLAKLLDMNIYISEGSLTQRFIPIIVPVKYANLLRLKLTTPIIMIDSIIISKNGKPMVYIKAYNNPIEKVIEITS